MAEIFGLVTGAVQALAAVDRAVEIFGRLQNAPKQIRLVRILLAQIEHDLVFIKQNYGDGKDEGGKTSNDHHPPVRYIPPATFAEIQSSLKECRDFVDKYNDDFSDTASRGRKFWSSVKHMGELGDIRARIAEVNPLIIMPLMIRLLVERVPAPVHRHEGRGAPLPLRQMVRDGAGSNMAPPLCDTCGLAAASAAAPALDGTLVPIPEYAQRKGQVQQVEQELNAALTINLRDVLETGAVEVDADLKDLRGATLYALRSLLHHSGYGETDMNLPK